MKVTDSVAAIICHLVYTMYNVPYIHINTFVGVNKYFHRVNATQDITGTYIFITYIKMQGAISVIWYMFKKYD